jgi:hypothetical protein
MHVVTPEVVSTNPQGCTTAYDVVVVGVTHKDRFKGAAAAKAEKKKQEHYNSHKKTCRDEGKTDPLALEVTLAVGREVKELGRDLKHACVRNQGTIDKQRIGSGGFQRRVGVPNLDHPPTRHGRNRVWGNPR